MAPWRRAKRYERRWEAHRRHWVGNQRAECGVRPVAVSFPRATLSPTPIAEKMLKILCDGCSSRVYPEPREVPAGQGHSWASGQRPHRARAVRRPGFPLADWFLCPDVDVMALNAAIWLAGWAAAAHARRSAQLKWNAGGHKTNPPAPIAWAFLHTRKLFAHPGLQEWRSRDPLRAGGAVWRAHTHGCAGTPCDFGPRVCTPCYCCCI